MPQSRETMEAVLLVGHGGPDMLVYRSDVPVPRAGPGEVLISVRAAGVNNTDINTRVGWYSSSFTGAPDEPTGKDTTLADGSWNGAAITFPRIQGADVCGLIVAVGEGVSEARIGERVIVQSCLRSLRRAGRDSWLGSELDGASRNSYARRRPTRTASRAGSRTPSLPPSRARTRLQRTCCIAPGWVRAIASWSPEHRVAWGRQLSCSRVGEEPR
jgi:hypothetical protein